MLQHIGYLWAAAVIVWGGTMAYMLSMYRRQVRLQKELDALNQTLQAELQQK
jgi:CcmD family protein